MRILHVLNGVPDTGNGIANAAVDLALEQRRLGHDVAVASAGGGFVGLLRDHSVTHRDIEFRKRSPAALAQAYRRLAAIIREEHPDIVHVHTLTPTVLAFVATRLRKPRLIATVHNEYKRGVELMGLADRVVGVSGAVSAAMARRRVPRKKIRTVLNGTVGSPRRQSHPAQPSVHLPPQSIVSVGAVSHRKGSDVLLAAFELVLEEFPQAHLYFVGHLDWTRPVDTAQRKTWSDLVHFVGFDARPERYLQEAAVFALASRRDPMPLALLEAMEAGLPIVASDVDGIPEALDFGRAGVLARAGDPADLATKISSLLRSEESRRRFADAARQRASSLTVATMTQGYLDVYRSAAS
jgi:glycosyltransferase involved in cell wall biosynthesis